MPMERRKFLIGTGALAAGGAAALGSGAFSRVESDRDVSIQVATDKYAYVGFNSLNNTNSQNYTGYDDNGHFYIDIGKIPEDEYDGRRTGAGVNSNSTTWFERLFRLCNQGKATATIAIDVAELDYHSSSHDGINDEGTPVVDVYYENSHGVEESILFDSSDGWTGPNWNGGRTLEPGDCEDFDLKTQTYGINARKDEPLVEGTAVVVADSPQASGGSGDGDPTSDA